MTAIGEPLKSRRQSRFKGAMILAMGLLAITMVVKGNSGSQGKKVARA